MNVTSLISAVSNTPVHNAIAKTLQNGEQNPSAVITARQQDNGINDFAYNQLVNTVQSLETLLDPSNNASQNAQSDTATAAVAAQAYGSTQALIPLLSKGQSVAPAQAPLSTGPGSVINAIV